MNILDYIILPLGWIMKVCYNLFKNYGLAIILFTLLSKVILIPVSVWVHKNSIKLVKMQPEINRMKVKFYGDADAIADEQAKIYKKAKYNPLASLIPLAIQIFLLMGVISVIYHLMTHLLGMAAGDIDGIIKAAMGISTNIDPEKSSVQLLTIEAIKKASDTGVFSGFEAFIESIKNLNLTLFGVDLTLVPSQIKGWTLVSPFLAGLSSWFLCFVQNRLNVLQSEQGNFNKYGTMAFSVGLSLYLGYFVPMGVAIYWIFSNLFSILQLLILNKVISPKKYVDYEELEASKAELDALENLGGKKKGLFANDENSKREKADYRRFFSTGSKHLVFYSESNGFYKYFEGVIRYLLHYTNIPIHYITSDPNDRIFELAKKRPQIKPYYIGEKKLITLFMKMDADMVVMTMSDLDNYHYKRSYVRKDIEYVYMFHYPLSTHMVLHTGALDHYDTILCVGEFQFAEIRKQEELNNLPEKKLIACGYGQLEKLYKSYKALDVSDRKRPKVLIAPSWQQDNILDSCLDSLLNELLGHGFDVVIRPHPEYMKRYRPRMDAIVERYKDYKGDDLHFELDFTSNSSIFDSDAVISDWSGTAYEFSFVTLKPAVFVDTPPKINNPEYVKLGIEPLELSLRNEMGIRVDPADMTDLADKLQKLFDDESFSDKILTLREKYIAHFGHSSAVAYKYIVHSLQKRAKERKGN